MNAADLTRHDLLDQIGLLVDAVHARDVDMTLSLAGEFAALFDQRPDALPPTLDLLVQLAAEIARNAGALVAAFADGGEFGDPTRAGGHVLHAALDAMSAQEAAAEAIRVAQDATEAP